LAHAPPLGTLVSEPREGALMEDRDSELQVAKRSLVCGGCGYGILRAEPPDRCPMCQAEDAWVDARPLSLTLLKG
jgi:rubrerythrin